MKYLIFAALYSHEALKICSNGILIKHIFIINLPYHGNKDNMDVMDIEIKIINDALGIPSLNIRT